MRRPSDPLSWKRARAVFEEVAGLGPLERDGRLAERCGDDDALRAEVESLLAYDATPGDVISAIIGQAALAATAGSSLHVGQTLLHYAVSGELGQGGMGVVWKATDRTLGRDVAIKVLPSAVSKDPSRLARFDREAKVLASLNHANIAAIYSLHESDGMRFLAMEYIEGDDLTVHIARGGLSLPDVLSVARQVADGLEEAHEKGVVHRDHAGGQGEGARLRPRQSHGTGCRRHGDRRLGEPRRAVGAGFEHRPHPRDGGLYAARAGARAGGGPPCRHLVVWRPALRDAGGPASVRRRHADRRPCSHRLDRT
jgi:hypothetical protein